MGSSEDIEYFESQGQITCSERIFCFKINKLERMVLWTEPEKPYPWNHHWYLSISSFSEMMNSLMAMSKQWILFKPTNVGLIIANSEYKFFYWLINIIINWLTTSYLFMVQLKVHTRTCFIINKRCRHFFLFSQTIKFLSASLDAKKKKKEKRKIEFNFLCYERSHFFGILH